MIRRVVAAAVLLMTLAAPSVADAQRGGQPGGSSPITRGRGRANSEGALFGSDGSRPTSSGLSLTATDEMVVDIRVEGLRNIPKSKVLSGLGTRVDRPYDPQLVRKDVAKLVRLPWFADVQAYNERTPQGRIVVLKVVERPTIRYVEYLGASSINKKKLDKETGLTVGGTLDPYSVNEGRKRIEQLYKSEGFNRVQVKVVEGLGQADKGVMFDINEGKQQKIASVVFEGNQFASDGQLRTKIQGKAGITNMLPKLFGGYYNREQILADSQSLTDYYRSFGFFQAKVKPIVEWNEAGTRATVRHVVYEGPQSEVRNISFVGTTLFDESALSNGLKVTSGQQYERDKVKGDVEWLKLLYGSHGYVFADVKPDVRYLEEPGKVDLVYSVEEGKRFRVGRIVVHIDGDNPHTRIQTALNRLSLRPGEIVDVRELRASERRLMQSALFHTEMARGIYPRITFNIPDTNDVVTASGQSNVRGQSPDAPSTRQSFYVQPQANAGDSDDKIDANLYISEDGHVEFMPLKAESAPQTHTVRKYPSPETDGQAGQSTANSAYDHLNVAPGASNRAPYPSGTYRGQSPQAPTTWSSGPRQPTSVGQVQPAGGAGAGYGGYAVQATGPQAVAPGQGTIQPTQYVNELPPPALPTPPGQPGTEVLPITPLPGNPPPAVGFPGSPVSPVVPFGEPVVDIDVRLQETQTGRLIMGVGVNSDAGVVGQFLIDEKNFDWRRPPTSFQDVLNGTAWRGGGQRFRLEAAPGSQVQRYLMSFQEPYLLDTNVSLSLSGSYYDRRFDDWDEQRLGGRIGFGYQWTQSDVSTTLSYRAEQVRLSNAATFLVPVPPPVPVPAPDPVYAVDPELEDAVGTSTLHGFRLAIVNNTRDSDFLPTQGHYFEIYGEQVIGTFSYPRGGFDLRKYFLINERADHSGRHVLSLTTKVNITGSDTPVYEHFFSGGFSTMRGFDFRGASPVSENDVRVGGEFQWLNSAEYMFPITADDMLHGVAFCDFGTTTPTASLDDFRVAPGFGLRITVPAMGPAPIALDFAFPVAKADFDDEQMFSFNIGFLR